jgi:hypothetical protein
MFLGFYIYMNCKQVWQVCMCEREREKDLEKLQFHWRSKEKSGDEEKWLQVNKSLHKTYTARSILHLELMDKVNWNECWDVEEAGQKINQRNKWNM